MKYALVNFYAPTDASMQTDFSVSDFLFICYSALH